MIYSKLLTCVWRGKRSNSSCFVSRRSLDTQTTQVHAHKKTPAPDQRCCPKSHGCHQGHLHFQNKKHAFSWTHFAHHGHVVVGSFKYASHDVLLHSMYNALSMNEWCMNMFPKMVPRELRYCVCFIPRSPYKHTNSHAHRLTLMRTQTQQDDKHA